MTNDKNLSNWEHNWLSPIYAQLKGFMLAKSIIHVDETPGQIINRSIVNQINLTPIIGCIKVCPSKVRPLSY
ncbi:hypothetical protein [Ammoniphilus sp. CFH 90114]|uniref:hypothetical protein n=1 Tax=Ammoniphilus sp. CFH 90114 TaxID=2493665 RepID=UPI00196B4FF5|nr:hypothetical protein [Ammoniphilus sp. CFH 90114]